jgi:hypothetical protein
MELGEIDALVATKIMGWKLQPKSAWGTEWWNGDEKERSIYSFCPSTDIAAAWEVVDKFTADGTFARIERGTTGGLGCPVTPHWEVGLSKDGYCYWAKASTAPLAICLAALKALGVKVKE